MRRSKNRHRNHQVNDGNFREKIKSIQNIDEALNYAEREILSEIVIFFRTAIPSKL